MSLPSLSVSANASSPIQHDGRGGAGQSAPQSEFGAIMRSLSEKSSPSESSESEKKASVPGAIPFARTGAATAVATIVDARAAVLQAALTLPPSAFSVSAASESGSSSLPEPGASAPGPGAATAVAQAQVVGPADAGPFLPASGESGESNALARPLSAFIAPAASQDGSAPLPKQSASTASFGAAAGQHSAAPAQAVNLPAVPAPVFTGSKNDSGLTPALGPGRAAPAIAPAQAVNRPTVHARLSPTASTGSKNGSGPAPALGQGRAAPVVPPAQPAALGRANPAAASPGSKDDSEPMLDRGASAPILHAKDEPIATDTLGQRSAETAAVAFAQGRTVSRPDDSAFSRSPTKPEELGVTARLPSGSARSPSASIISNASGEPSPSLPDQSLSAPRFVSVAEKDPMAPRVLSAPEASAVSASPHGGAQDAVRSPAPERDTAAPDPRSFASAAAAMRLRVSRSASHFGPSSPSQLPKAGSTESASAAVSSAQPSNGAPAPNREAPLSTDSAGQVTPGSAAIESAATATPINGASLPLLPDVIADAAVSLEPPQAAPKASTAVPAGPAANVKPEAVRELDIRLAPPELGSLSVKLKLSGGALSVVIEASKPSTLAAIERERETILSRITSADREVSSLVLRPADPTRSMHEDGDAYDAAAANGNRDQGQTERRSQWSETGSRKKNSGLESPAPSHGADGLVV